MLKYLDDHSIMLVYSLLVGTPTGLSLDLFSTARDSCLTRTFGRRRGWLSQSPPSTIRVVPLTYLPSKCKYTSHGLRGQNFLSKLLKLEKQWQEEKMFATVSSIIPLTWFF